MKVLILAYSDWAGVGNLLTRSLCRVGVDAKFFVSHKSRYKYPSLSISKKEAIKFGTTCDIIQYMHSTKVSLGIDLRNKKVVVFHGGGKFRNNSKNVCSIFNPIVDCSIIQTYDLFGLGAKNEKWLLPPVDTNMIQPVYRTEGPKIIVGHYPSIPKGKGTETIGRIIKDIRGQVPDFEFRVSAKKVSWKEQLKRMSSVDIYVERMSLKQQGKRNKSVWSKTGVWGMTALEASALGKVVVTNFYGEKKYKKEYGECQLQIANSEKDMKKVLIHLLSKSKKNLLELKLKTRKWVEDTHSFEAIGYRLRGIYDGL